MNVDNFVIGAGVAALVGLIALVLRSRLAHDAPTQRTYVLPTQIDRSDFGSPDEDWLVLVFTSSSCHVCADVAAKVSALASRHVATRIIDYASERSLHDRYDIDAVPAVLIVDPSGVVRHHVLGPVTATDLWAGVASVRTGDDPASGHCSSAQDRLENFE